MLFRDSAQINLHFESKHNTCTSSNGFRRTECFLLICGSHYPIGEDTEATNGRGGGAAAGEDNAIERTTRSRPGEINIDPSSWSHPFPNDNPALEYMQYFHCMPCNNMVSSSSVEAILTHLIDKDDVTDQWLKLYHKWIATSDEHFVEKKRLELEEDHLKPELVLRSCLPLQRLMDLFIDLECHIKGIVDGIPANWKARLVKFELTKDGDDALEGATTWTFRYRNNSSPQLREFGHLLCYLCYFKCPILTKYIDLTSSGDYDQKTAFRAGIVPRLIYELAVEAVPDGDYIPWIGRFALWRCLMLKDGAPRLKSSNVCSKQLATTLYFLREGVLACASMTMNGGYSQQALPMIVAVQEGHVINIISPWISYCRAMTNRIAQKETSHLLPNGDIMCNNAVFRRCIYSQLTPLVRSSIVRLFGQIFLTKDWELFLCKKARIAVSTLILILC